MNGMIDTYEKFMSVPGRGEPYHFGLGFIKCRLNNRFSANFYHPDLEKTAEAEEWHDHRYDFTSKIVAGTLTNVITNVTDQPHVGTLDDTPFAYNMWEAECKPGEEVKNLGCFNVGDVLTWQVLQAGSEYYMHRDAFHQVAAPDGAITLLDRRPIVKSTARVLKPIDQGTPTCPYSPKKTPEEIYALIKDLYERLK